MPIKKYRILASQYNKYRLTDAIFITRNQNVNFVFVTTESGEVIITKENYHSAGFNVLSVKQRSENLWKPSNRSSRPKVFCKKGALKNFTNFTGKRLCQSLFNKVACLRPSTLLKKRLCHRCFLVNFVKFLRTPFL